MSDKTQINNELSGQMQSRKQQSSTVINTDLNSQLTDLAGQYILNRKYIIQEKLPTGNDSGEADLYIVKSTDSEDHQKYVAKIYRRSETFSARKTEILKKINSPYVARIADLGTYKKRQVIVIPFYERGSLEGKIIRSLQELKPLIFQLNEGLRALHEQGIIHKDIKPANIMIRDNGEIAIIDFGISSVLDSNATVSKTKLGLTPQYSALETLVGGNFIKESDYYSFGIVLYVLYTGHTPYQSDDEAENSSFQLLQHLPFPQDMPAELVDLIKGLTYKDISNRHDPDNPNRRWTYNEVKNWLEGRPAVVPGYSSGKDASETEVYRGTTVFPLPYKFNNRNYSNSYELAEALAENWTLGQKHLFRGLLTSFFKNNGLSDLTIICTDAEEEYRKGKNADNAYFDFLFRFDPNLTVLAWKNRHFRNLSDLSDSYLSDLFNNGDQMGIYIADMFEQGIPLRYAQKVAPDEKEIHGILRNLEDMFKISRSDQLLMKKFKYTLAYTFATNKYYKFHNSVFNNPEETTEYFFKLINLSFTDYEMQHREFTAPENKLILDIWMRTIEN